MENFYWFLYIAIMLFIVWVPVIVWVLLFLLFVYFSISAFYFKKSQKQTVFLLFLVILVFSFPAFKVFSSWRGKKLDSMKMQEVREEGRVVQGLELPIGTKLSYRVGKHDFKDEDIGEIYFQSEFFWSDLKIDYISYPKSYTSTLYFYENDLDIVGNVISVNVGNDSVIDG